MWSVGESSFRHCDVQLSVKVLKDVIYIVSQHTRSEGIPGSDPTFKKKILELLLPKHKI